MVETVSATQWIYFQSYMYFKNFVVFEKYKKAWSINQYLLTRHGMNYVWWIINLIQKIVVKAGWGLKVKSQFASSLYLKFL